MRVALSASLHSTLPPTDSSTSCAYCLKMANLSLSSGMYISAPKRFFCVFTVKLTWYDELPTLKSYQCCGCAFLAENSLAKDSFDLIYYDSCCQKLSCSCLVSLKLATLFICLAQSLGRSTTLNWGAIAESSICHNSISTRKKPILTPVF